MCIEGSECMWWWLLRQSRPQERRNTQDEVSNINMMCNKLKKVHFLQTFFHTYVWFFVLPRYVSQFIFFYFFKERKQNNVPLCQKLYFFCSRVCCLIFTSLCYAANYVLCFLICFWWVITCFNLSCGSSVDCFVVLTNWDLTLQNLSGWHHHI